MVENFTLIAFFATGLLGSIHCVGMCGGISSALSFAVPKEKLTNKYIFLYHINYSFGRISTYTIIGAISGLFGSILSNILGNFGPQFLRMLAGVMLILLGLHLTNWWLGIRYIEEIGIKIWRLISPITKHFIPVTSLYKGYLLGMVWGALPCGLVYSTLALALTQSNWQKSSLMMTIFGIGTMPAMFLTGTLSKHFSKFLKEQSTRHISGGLIIIFGIWTLVASFLTKTNECCN